LALLPASGQPVTTLELVDKFYKNKETPEHARIVIGGVVRSLVKKTARTRGGIKVRSSQRRGQFPMEVWIETKKNGSA
jgi:hypothetical protein